MELHRNEGKAEQAKESLSKREQVMYLNSHGCRVLCSTQCCLTHTDMLNAHLFRQGLQGDLDAVIPSWCIPGTRQTPVGLVGSLVGIVHLEFRAEHHFEDGSP